MISLALNFDHTGPQGAKSKYPAMGRTNPIHTMIRTGTDAYSGVLDKRGIRAADDMVTIDVYKRQRQSRADEPHGRRLASAIFSAPPGGRPEIVRAENASFA